MTMPLSFTTYKTGYATLTHSTSSTPEAPAEPPLQRRELAMPEMVHPFERSLPKSTLMGNASGTPVSDDSWLCHRVVNEHHAEFDVEFMCHIHNTDWHKILATVLMFDDVPPRYRKLRWLVQYNKDAGIAAFTVDHPEGETVMYILTRPKLTPEGDEF